jgi:hypothetical protein
MTISVRLFIHPVPMTYQRSLTLCTVQESNLQPSDFCQQSLGEQGPLREGAPLLKVDRQMRGQRQTLA